VWSNEPVKNGCEVIYEMFHILNCGFWVLNWNGTERLLGSPISIIQLNSYRSLMCTVFHSFPFVHRYSVNFSNGVAYGVFSVFSNVSRYLV